MLHEMATSSSSSSIPPRGHSIRATYPDGALVYSTTVDSRATRTISVDHIFPRVEFTAAIKVMTNLWYDSAG